jgi:hypothetical protein
MTQGRQRQPFEMPFTFSLNNILSIVADHLTQKFFPKLEAVQVAGLARQLFPKLDASECIKLTQKFFPKLEAFASGQAQPPQSDPRPAQPTRQISTICRTGRGWGCVHCGSVSQQRGENFLRVKMDYEIS